MKRVIVIAVAALMLACVLPMAQAREAASNEGVQVTNEEDIRLSQQVEELQARLEQLRILQEQLQDELSALAEQRQGRQVRASEEHRNTGGRNVAPLDTPASEMGMQAGPSQERAMRAREQAARAAAERAAMAVREQYRNTHMRVMGEHLRQWEQSEQMQQWRRDIENWQRQMQEWGQEMARRQGTGGDAVADPAPEMPPMPPMPEAPADLPVLVPQANTNGTSATAGGAITHSSGTSVPMHRAGPTVPAHVPQVHSPRVEMGRVEMPVLPTIPEHAENLEAAEHRAGFGPIPADGLLEVSNQTGAITVRSGDEPEHLIRATIVGKAATKERAQEIAERLTLTDTGLQSDGVERIIVGKPEGLRDGEGCSVNLELTVPRDARIRLRQTLGDIHLVRVAGSIDALTQMGSIRATGVSGNVVLKTDLGEIDFTVATDLSARVRAESGMGSIQSDLPVLAAYTSPSLRSRAAAIIGAGEGDIFLRTSMGSIRIRSEAVPSGTDHVDSPGVSEAR